MSEEPLPDWPTFCWPTNLECVPDWDDNETEADPEADPPVEAVPKYTDEEKARAIAMAGQTLRYLTGFRVGGCPVVVRPCRARCDTQTWRTYPVSGFSGSTPWYPVQLGGQWLNIGCGCAGNGCSCTAVSEVRLWGPVGVIESVKVDGVELTADVDYRLDAGGRLVRMGAAWPICQDMAAPDSEEGTWSVTYTAGLPVDGLGAWAAGLLAGQYVKACKTGECDLPDTVTQLVRDGVTMTIGEGVFPDNKTGIRAVDEWVARYNPSGLRSAPVVWSPDIARPRTQGMA